MTLTMTSRLGLSRGFFLASGLTTSSCSCRSPIVNNGKSILSASTVVAPRLMSEASVRWYNSGSNKVPNNVIWPEKNVLEQQKRNRKKRMDVLSASIISEEQEEVRRRGGVPLGQNIPPIEEVIASDPAFQSPDYFQVHNIFTVRDLYDARVHLGHKLGSLNPRMNDFIFGSRFESVIFDLDKTAFHLRQALNFVAHIAYRKGIILFISRSPHTMHLVEKTAIECGEYAHCRDWHTHVMTNSIHKFGGITRLPDVFVLLNTLDSVMAPHGAVTDANKMLIPTVGVVDSNCDPNSITYPIPGNDDTYCAIEFYCKVFKEAIMRGKQKRRNLESQLQEQQEEEARKQKVAV